MRASFWPALIQDYWTPSGSCALALSVRQGRITGGMKKEGSIWPIIILEDFLFSFLVGFLRSDWFSKYNLLDKVGFKYCTCEPAISFSNKGLPCFFDSKLEAGSRWLEEHRHTILYEGTSPHPRISVTIWNPRSEAKGLLGIMRVDIFHISLFSRSFPWLTGLLD